MSSNGAFLVDLRPLYSLSKNYTVVFKKSSYWYDKP